jgi:PAS domain S-box-containing protein
MKRKSPLLSPLELAILLVSMLVIGARAVTVQRLSREKARDQVLARAVERLPRHLLSAHLWFEEALSGDKSVDLAVEVFAEIDQADRLAAAMIEGGEVDFGRIEPLRDPAALQHLGDLRRGIAEWRRLTASRSRERDLPGSASDAEYDFQFKKLLGLSDRIQAGLDVARDRERSIAAASGVAVNLFMAALFAGTLLLARRARRAFEIQNQLLESRIAERTADLAESEARTRAVLDGVADGILTVDPCGTIESFSRSAEAIFGLSAAAARGRSLGELVPELAAGEVLARARGAGPIERVGRRADGTSFPLEVDLGDLEAGGRTGLIAVVRDITRRLRMTAALRETTALQKAILDSANYSIISVSGDGTIRTFNATAERWLGYRAEEVVGRVTPSVFHDRDEVARRSEELSRELGRRIEPGFETFVARARQGIADENEWTYVRKDGTRFAVQLSVTVLRDEAGEVTGFLGVALDIGERKRAEAELRAAVEAARSASEAKSRFLASMSHELRTPLNSVIGFANVLLKNKRGSLDPAELNYLGRIVDNGKHLLSLINTILDVSKVEAGKMEMDMAPLALEPLVRSTVAQLEGQIRERDVELVADVPADLEPVLADAGRLRQVLINLAGNALKFTEKGTVTVRVIAAADSRAPVALEVADTGIGIPPDRLPRIFEAFEQADGGTSRKYGGTGLGLTLSRAMIEAMGHRLEVESEVGKGSVFRIRFLTDATSSRAGDLTEAAVPPAPAPAVAAMRDRVVLVIDDAADSRVLLWHAIRETGCRVITAASGTEGLALARRARPDLITLDLKMPDRSGFEVLRELQDDPALRAIPVVVVSVAASENRAAVLGAVDCMDKPVSREDVERLVRRYVGAAAGRILVVDDDADTRLLLAASLAGQGFEVRVAAEGSAALAEIAGFSPQLVVLDLFMPGMDGVTFLGHLRADPRWADLPVIVVTAAAGDAPERVRAAALTSLVLRKDGGLDDALGEAVRRLLGSR